jgi:preprotein translocase SecE subunit
VARTSRQERRQRRGIAAGSPPLQPARKPQPVEPVREEKVESAASKSDAGAASQSEGKRGFPGVRFIREAVAELRKVEWPTQQKVVSGTAVVIMACLIVGTFLYINDRVWAYVVQHILLR